MHCYYEKTDKIGMVIFASPPKNSFFYKELKDVFWNIKIIITLFSSNEKKNMSRLEIDTNTKFWFLDPPDLESDEEEDETSTILQN